MGQPSKRQVDVEAGAPAMVAAMMAVNPIATKAWMDVLVETAQFMTDRVQQNWDTQRTMLACKSPAELVQVQSKFVEKAVEQYTGESRRLYAMMSRAMGVTIKDAQYGHARRYDDVPL